MPRTLPALLFFLLLLPLPIQGQTSVPAIATVTISDILTIELEESQFLFGTVTSAGFSHSNSIRFRSCGNTAVRYFYIQSESTHYTSASGNNNTALHISTTSHATQFDNETPIYTTTSTTPRILFSYTGAGCIGYGTGSFTNQRIHLRLQVGSSLPKGTYTIDLTLSVVPQ